MIATLPTFVGSIAALVPVAADGPPDWELKTMKWLGSAAEFGLVAAMGLMLTVQATGQASREPQAPAPSADQIAAAVDFAEREAARVNGAR
ncbi:MAG TPA: hypothetical protein VF577_06565 [Allosphingosinicella sp.]|jgi:hypothetical protein